MATLLEKLNIRSCPNVVENGRLVELFRGDQEFKEILGEVRQISIIQLKPGALAGNHVHTRKTEILYLHQGRLRAILQDRETGERLDIILESGSKFNMVPNVEHLFENVSPELVIMIECTNMAYDASDPDAIKVQLDRA